MVTGANPEHSLEHSNSQMTLPASTQVKEGTPPYESHSFLPQKDHIPKKTARLTKFMSPFQPPQERKFQKM
jgi:hypothetical protein